MACFGKVGFCTVNDLVVLEDYRKSDCKEGDLKVKVLDGSLLNYIMSRLQVEVRGGVMVYLGALGSDVLERYKDH